MYIIYTVRALRSLGPIMYAYKSLQRRWLVKSSNKYVSTYTYRYRYITCAALFLTNNIYIRYYYIPRVLFARFTMISVPITKWSILYT